MAYKNLISQACVDKNEAFCRLRDFICKRNGTYDYSTTGIGWTLHDSSYATDEDNCALNDWYVIYSPGEGGDEDLYYKVTWVSTELRIYGYLSWDATTHAGSVRYCGHYDNFNLAESSAQNIWIYGDLDMCTLINRASVGVYDAVSFGKLQPGYDDMDGSIATCTTTLTAGSDVTILLDATPPTEWSAGDQLFIRTTHNDAMGTTEIEKITIKTITSNAITADLDEDFTTGAKLSKHVGYCTWNTENYGGGADALIADDGTYNIKHTPAYLTLTTSYFDPATYNDRWYLMEIFFQSIPGFLGKLKYVRRVPTFVTGLTYEDVLDDPDGGEWRAFKVYSGFYFGIWEV